MEILRWLRERLIPVPGRLTSAASEKVICGADEVYDDTLEARQSSLNAQFKAITDQMQLSINGDGVELANSPEAIVAGSGKVPTANAIALMMDGYQKTALSTVAMTEDAIITEMEVPEGSQVGIIYVNSTGSELTLTILNVNFRTPDGDNITIPVPSGGYGEVNFLNIGGTIFARGC